jgi:hypothetical protein
MSNLRGLIRGKWNCLADVILRLDGHLGGHVLRYDRIWVGQGQGFPQFLELYGCQKHVCRLAMLHVTVIGAFYIPFDGDDFVWAQHLQDQVAKVRNHHELGECRPSEECIVCHFEISYLELHVLSAKVLSSPEGHGKSDLADAGRRCSGDYFMEGSPTVTPNFMAKPNAHTMCAQESSLHTYHLENGYIITNVLI